jgi:hypothetical protein
MQLADDVERKYNGQPAAPRPRHPVICSRHLATQCRLVSTSHVSPSCESTHTAALPEFSTALPMTPNIYYQRQPWLTNNSRVFTQSGTHATNIGSAAALSGDI